MSAFFSKFIFLLASTKATSVGSPSTLPSSIEASEHRVNAFNISIVLESASPKSFTSSPSK